MILDKFTINVEYESESMSVEERATLERECKKAVREVIASFVAVDWDTIKVTVS